MATLGGRGKTFEDKFAHDETQNFKARIKRAHLFGSWVADEIGVEGLEKDALVRAYTGSELLNPDEKALLTKAMGDFTMRKIDMSLHRLEKRLDEMMEKAKAMVAEED